jgi:uncharacterized protein YbdZ (MbtH family)
MMQQTAKQAEFFSLVNNKVKFSIYLLKKVPAAWFSGVRMLEANSEKCVASIPFKWLSQNPFRSMYFASMSMAAELTTGLLAMSYIWKNETGVSMLITGMNGSFYKKATGKVFFTCQDGLAMKQAIEKAISSGEPQQVTSLSTGRNRENEIVAEFYFTWSFKLRK